MNPTVPEPTSPYELRGSKFLSSAGKRQIIMSRSIVVAISVLVLAGIGIRLVAKDRDNSFSWQFLRLIEN